MATVALSEDGAPFSRVTSSVVYNPNSSEDLASGSAASRFTKSGSSSILHDLVFGGLGVWVNECDE